MGNHFAEFLSVKAVFMEEEFKKLNLTSEDVFLLIHSGSRSYGESIYEKEMQKGIHPLEEESTEFKEYMSAH